MQELNKSEIMYGVEIWRWSNSEKLERLHVRCVELAIGINRNKLVYIRGKEAECREIEMEL